MASNDGGPTETKERSARVLCLVKDQEQLELVKKLMKDMQIQDVCDDLTFATSEHDFESDSRYPDNSVNVVCYMGHSGGHIESVLIK